MYERFTDRVRKVLQTANQEAQRYNHTFVGTEHILLALVREGNGAGVTVLKNLGVSIQDVLSAVEDLMRSGPQMVTMGALPRTPKAKKVVEFAMEEARTLGQNYVGTDHLLLGLAREGEGLASQVLCSLGLTVDKVREAVKSLGYKEAPIAGESSPGEFIEIGEGIYIRSLRSAALDFAIAIGEFWSQLADAVGCRQDLYVELCRVLRESPYIDQLREIAARVYDELQKQGDADVLLRVVLERSRTLAKGLKHEVVEPLHVFVALVGEARGRLSDALRENLLVYDRLRIAIGQRFTEKERTSDRALPLSQEVESWLLTQLKRVALRRDAALSVEALLLDIFAAPDRQVQQFLADHRIDVDRVRGVFMKAGG